VEVEIRERLSVDLLQKCQELLGAMARQAFPDDLAGRHVEGGEQRRGPVTLRRFCQLINTDEVFGTHRRSGHRSLLRPSRRTHRSKLVLAERFRQTLDRVDPA
jgi:hypothetical protein